MEVSEERSFEVDYTRFPKTYSSSSMIYYPMTSMRQLTELEKQVKTSDELENIIKELVAKNETQSMNNRNGNKKVTSTGISEQGNLPVALIEAVLFNYLPCKKFYPSAVEDKMSSGFRLPEFGETIVVAQKTKATTNEEDDVQEKYEDEIVELLTGCLNTTNGRIDLVELFSTVFLARQSYANLKELKIHHHPSRNTDSTLRKWKLVCQAERILFTLCFERFLFHGAETAFAEKNLIKLSKIVDFIRSFNVFENQSREMEHLNRFISELETQRNVKNKPIQAKKNFSSVLSELNKKLFGDKKRKIDAQLRGRIEDVRSGLDEFNLKFKQVMSDYERLSQVSTNEAENPLRARKNVAEEINEIKLKLEELDIKQLKQEKQELLCQKRQRLVQIAKLKNKLTEMSSEKEDTKKKTLKFAANFMKDEYKAKLNKAMKQQETLFLSQQEKLTAEHDETLKVLESTNLENEQKLKSTIETLSSNIHALANEKEALEKLLQTARKENNELKKHIRSGEKIRQLLGNECTGAPASGSPNPRVDKKLRTAKKQNTRNVEETENNSFTSNASTVSKKGFMRWKLKK